MPAKRNEWLAELQQQIRDQRQTMYAKQTETEHARKEIRDKQDQHEVVSLQLARNEGR